MTSDGGRLDFAGKRAMLMDVAGGLYALKKTLRSDVGFFEKEFMYKAAQEGAKEFLSGVQDVTASNDPKSIIEFMLGLYSLRGYGEFKVLSFDKDTKTVEISSPNTAEAWSFKENRDLQREPVCTYTSGMLSSICRLALVKGMGEDYEMEVFETECVGEGKSGCKFVVAPEEELKSRFPKYDRPKLSLSEHELKLNEEILVKNLELQNLNLALERQVRKRTEELWRAEENYRSLMRLSPDPVVIVAMNGRIHSTNASGLRLLGIEALEDAPEFNVTSMLTDPRTAWDKILWLLEKEGTIGGLEVEFTRTNGTKVVGQINARFADLLPGRCVEAVFKDVTDKKIMEEQVKEARSETEFLNDLLSHDIMNYAFSALHFLDKLWRSNKIAEEDRHSLAVVTKDIQGAFELASSVRDLTKIKSVSKDDLIVKDLKLLIVEATEDTKRMFSDRRVRIDFERHMEPRYVRCSTLATRMFSNLLSNAVKFNTHEEAVVEVTVDNVVDNDTSYWRVRVSDHGKGIPDDEKEKVFARFHRLDTTIPGTGLGLFVAKFIAEASGGRIWAENRVSGDHLQGTTMVVLLQKADERDIARMPRRP